ncbi:MAG: isochorismatase family protein [Acidobacteria bacterium]|nr:isochorismatase family protein [Acidobacteriota bacterium]
MRSFCSVEYNAPVTLRRSFLASAAACSLAAAPTASLAVTLRSRKHGLAVEARERWSAAETAILICDMWNGHYCQNAVKRIGEIVPRMNATLTAARALGVQIIHAPSGVTGVYEDTPQRARMKNVTRATPPVPIAKWCYLDRTAEAPLPIDDATESCDDDVVGAAVRRFDRQHPGLTIAEPDGLSDSGEEIYSFLHHRGIRHVAMMGVHTNMCVLGRPFGIRQLTRLGFHVTLVRDLTDAMYDPRQAPWVSHARGTALVIEHIEQYWCPSIESPSLMRAAEKS